MVGEANLGILDPSPLLSPRKTEMARQRIALAPGSQQRVDFLAAIRRAVWPVQRVVFIAARVVEREP
jgi:hypothetical protein